MTVKIVTDTLSDITGDLADELGLTVVPLYVRFGEEIYKDRVEITSEDFYRRLVHESILPSTTQPTPNDFIDVYNRLLFHDSLNVFKALGDEIITGNTGTNVCDLNIVSIL